MDVLILHAIASSPRAHWQGWLADELVSCGYRVYAPSLPDAEHPDRSGWLQTVESNVAGLPLGELVIVGHSLGVTTALDYLEAAGDRIRGLVSVAGFASDYGSDLNSYFLKAKDIDFSVVRNHVSTAHVFYGDDDPYVTQDALREIANGLQADPVIIPGGGHLNTEAGFPTFPQLLDVVTSLDHP